MDRAKSDDGQEALNNAAEESVRDAIARGRIRRTNRRSVHSGEVTLENPAKCVTNKRSVPMEQKLFVPYLKKRRTSLIPNGEHDEDDDSNDEWEATVELDPKVMEAAAASLKETDIQENAKSKDEGEKGRRSQYQMKQESEDQQKRPSVEDEKARRRLQAAARRKKFLLRHSVHIILSIAYYMRLESAANDDHVRCYSLSVTPKDTLLSNEAFLEQLSRLALWLRAFFRTTAFVGETKLRDTKKLQRPCSASRRAIHAVQNKHGDILDVLTVVAATIRAQGFRCRIVYPLQPVSHKAPATTRKENKVTGRKQIVEVQPDERTESIFFGWVEIWASPSKMWVPVDVCSGQVCIGLPTESIMASIEQIPETGNVPAEGHGGTSSDKQSYSPKDDLKRRKSKRMNKRPRPSASPSPPRRRVGSNMFFHVVAVENGTVTDVTQRYSRGWNAIEKARAKGKIFEKAVENLSIGPSDRDSDEALKLEQEEFDKIAANEEVPTSITAIQRHPRYVLERHLKKYEIIFPREPVVGYIKEEAIFLRSNIQLLHTRDRWIRRMREVKDGARPPKSVRSMNGTDATVDLYGYWQTTPLIIPPCVNGRVPRGIHGNVDLWTPTHLPQGTRHVNLQCAKIAARTLQVDFAPAMTGFDIRGGRSVPRIEGIVVATENEEIVRDAAGAAAEAAAERREERAKEEALRKWLQLLRAVKARQQVRRRYGTGISHLGTHEAAQQRAGRRNEEEEQNGAQDSAKESSLPVEDFRKPKQGDSKAHAHEFGEATPLHGDTLVRACKLCGLKMSFEVL